MSTRASIALLALAACASLEANDEAALPPAENMLRSWTQVFLRRDVPTMLEHYAPAADTILIHSPGVVVRGIDAIRRDYATAFGSTEFLAAQYQPAFVREVGTCAWATGRLWMHTRQAGRDFVLEIWTSFTMQWIDGSWRIVMEQSTPLEGIPRIRELRPGETPMPPETSRVANGAAGSKGR